MPGQDQSKRENTMRDDGDGEQDSPAANVLTADERENDGDEDAKRNPDAPQHGGYGRPV
jgi:hypothetical protein